MLHPLALRRSGRLHTILQTSGPLILVNDGFETSHGNATTRRLAHDLNVYHKLDSEIIIGVEALHRYRAGTLGPGNVVVIGTTAGQLVRQCLGERQAAFEIGEDLSLRLRGQVLDSRSEGMLREGLLRRSF